MNNFKQTLKEHWVDLIFILFALVLFIFSTVSCSKITNNEVPVRIYSPYVIQYKNNVEYHYNVIGYKDNIPIIDSEFTIKIKTES